MPGYARSRFQGNRFFNQRIDATRLIFGRQYRGGEQDDGKIRITTFDVRCEAGAIHARQARSTVEKSDEYVQHATNRVFPTLRASAGYRGAYPLRRAVDGAIEFVVLTLWVSMEAIRKFAGDEPEKAVGTGSASRAVKLRRPCNGLRDRKPHE